jgi:hypothetical protein
VRTALKEWAVVIEALARGRQRFLLRKGGIAEGKQGFEVKHNEFLLYPTWEHQHLDSIRPEFQGLFEQAQPRTSGVVRFQYLANVTDVLRAPASPAALRALDDDHIWAPSYLEKRYGYRPDLPLFVIVLRLYRLTSEGEIPENRRYAGCRSWVDLDQEIDTSRLQPLEPEATFAEARKLLLEKLLKYGALAAAPARTTLRSVAKPQQ